MDFDLKRNPQLIAAAACFLLGAALLLLSLLPRLGLLQASPPPTPEILDTLAEFEDTEPTGPTELVVYITGGVRYPDVYRLPVGTRVKDAVLAAGGLRPDAAADQINLAAPLTDAGHVHIPIFSDQPAPAADAPASQGLLDLNQASLSDLEDLPGIGPALAERIVARRTEEGPFRNVEDLRGVTGVGEKLYGQIAPLVTVGP